MWRKAQGPAVATAGPCLLWRIGRRIGRLAGSLPLTALGRRGAVLGVLVGNPVALPEPPPEVDHPAPAGAERVVRVILPVAGHRRVADRTSHLIHRFGPSRTSGISHTAPSVRLLGGTLVTRLPVGRRGRRLGLRLRLGLGARRAVAVRLRLPVAVGPGPAVVGLVEARALEDDRPAAAEEALELVLLARRALR